MLIRWKSKDKSSSSGNSKKKRKGREGGKHPNQKITLNAVYGFVN